MNDKKLECLGWDLYPREKSLNPVTCLDTSSIADHMDTSEVVILARPCHHRDLIDSTIKSALEIGEAFYIGKPENVHSDLAAFKWDIVAEDVGEAEEVLIRVKCAKDNYYIHRLIDNGGRREWWWYDEKRSRYVGSPGGLAGFDDLGDTEVFKEEHWSTDLQVIETKEEGCYDASNMGWIAPDGEWFGCHYAGHDALARSVLGCSVKRLEELGFARCHGQEGRRKVWTWGWSGERSLRDRKPTRAQIKTLVAKGYDPKF
jgi:hypothetical protein